MRKDGRQQGFGLNYTCPQGTRVVYFAVLKLFATGRF